MLYKVSVSMGCGYTEISRRRALEKAIIDALRAVNEYGAECAPLINGRPYRFVMNYAPVSEIHGRNAARIHTARIPRRIQRGRGASPQRGAGLKRSPRSEKSPFCSIPGRKVSL